MVLELFKYDFHIVHVPGKKLYVADALSRAPVSDTIDTKFLEAGAATVHTILTSSEEKTRELQVATQEDPELLDLIKHVKDGWPSNIRQLSSDLKPYWENRSELHYHEGLVFCGNRLVVPKKMRKVVLEKLHIAHQGITSCQKKARNAVYWPNLMEDVKNLVYSCQICQKHQRANTKESLIPYKIPKLPWEDVGVDFMYMDGADFLQVIDYHSKFVEVKKITRKMAEAVISALKQIFRMHGIAQNLHSDNGPPFDSRMFQQFLKDYDIQHVTSSPKLPKSNGMIERSIGTMKSILFKVKQAQGDPNLALMEYNNTPKFNLPSPAQMLMGRSLRTLIPTKSTFLKPKFHTKETLKSLENNQRRQQEYHDKSAVILPKLQPQQPIYIQTGHHEWTPGTVVKDHGTPRLYIVKTSTGTELRRNRIHLRPDKGVSKQETSGKDPNMSDPSSRKEDIDNVPLVKTLPNTMSPRLVDHSHPQVDRPSGDGTATCTPRRERPARLVKPPIKLQDYVR